MVETAHRASVSNSMRFILTHAWPNAMRFIRTHAWHCCRQCPICGQDLVERLALWANRARLASIAHSSMAMHINAAKHTVVVRL